MPSVKVLRYTKDYMDVLKEACSKPYGNNVSDKGVQRIIESGHISILEHVHISLVLTCSVAVLGQLTRHRHLSFTVQSARGKEFDTFIDPIGFEEIPLDKTEIGKCYHAALADGMTFDQARYFLPQGIKTEMVISGNARAWYEWIPKRICRRAMEEHRVVARLIYEQLSDIMPEVFNRPMMACRNCTEKSCEFK